MNPPKLPFALCGLGRFATKRILPAVARSNSVELSAVIDPSGKSNGLSKDVKIYLSLDEYLRTHPLGAIYIATPNYLHAEQTIKCLSSGLHVLCEKPMATHFFDCQSMIKMAENSKTYLQIGHMLQYSPALKLAKKWVNEGLIGQLNKIKTVFNYDLPSGSRTWASNFNKAGGGSFIDAGIHCVDTIRFMLEAPIEVMSASTDARKYADGIERRAECSLKLGGVEATIAVNAQSPYLTLLEIEGQEGKIEVENFAACWGMLDVKLYDPLGNKIVKNSKVDVSGTYDLQLESFVSEAKKTPFNYTQAFHAAQNIKIIEEMYEKSRHS